MDEKTLSHVFEPFFTTKVPNPESALEACRLRHQVMGKEMRLVRKPFKPELLARAVREVLNGS